MDKLTNAVKMIDRVNEKHLKEINERVEYLEYLIECNQGNNQSNRFFMQKVEEEKQKELLVRNYIFMTEEIKKLYLKG